MPGTLSTRVYTPAKRARTIALAVRPAIRYRNRTIGTYARYPLSRLVVNYDTSCFPNKMLTTLRYFESHSAWDPGVTGTYEYVYRGNDPYDPYQTGVGSKAVGFDSMAVAYRRYTVLESTITWEGHCNEAAHNVDVYIVPHVLSTNLSTPAYFQSLPGCVVKHLSTDGRDDKLVATCRTADIFGKRSGWDLDRQDSGAFSGTSPAECWYWHILIHHETAADVDIQGKLKIDYKTVCIEPIAVS